MKDEQFPWMLDVPKTVSACGVESAGPRQVVQVKLATVKQEANAFG